VSGLQLLIPSFDPTPLHIVESVTFTDTEVPRLVNVLQRCNMDARAAGFVGTQTGDPVLNPGVRVSPSLCLAWGAILSRLIECEPRWVFTHLTPIYDQEFGVVEDGYSTSRVCAASITVGDLLSEPLTPLDDLYARYLDRAGELRRLLFAASGSASGLECLEYYA
jgi:hypothetical protein